MTDTDVKDDNTGLLIIKIEGTGLSVSTHVFSGMQRTTQSAYRFQLPNTLLGNIEALENFEILLKRPVSVYGKLVVLRTDPTEINYRAHIRESFIDLSDRALREKRVATENLLAAKLQFYYPSLEFSYCHDLACDEVCLHLKEKAVIRKGSMYLWSQEVGSTEIFYGEIDMETSDNSGFGIRLRQFDLMNLRKELTRFVGKEAPIELIVE